MLSKRMFVINWLSKSLLLILRTPSTSGLVIKTWYNLDKQGIEKNIEDVCEKIPNTNGLIKKSDYRTKTIEIEKNI